MTSVPSPSGFNAVRIIRIITIIIPLALVGNIGYALLATDFSVLRGLGDYRFLYLVIAALLVFVPWAAHTFRILLWGRAFGRHLTIGESFRTAVATDLGAAIVPSTIGGSYAKFGILSSFGFSPGEATLVTLLGALEDGAFFVVAIPLAFLTTGAWNDPGIRQVATNVGSHWPVFAGIGLAVIVAYILITKTGRSRVPQTSGDTNKAPAGFFRRMVFRLKVYQGQFAEAQGFVRRNHKGTFFLCSLIAGIGWMCRYSVITLLVLGMGRAADPVLFFLLQWIVFTLMTLFPTPGAIGGAEVSLALIFQGVVAPGLIPILTGIWRFLTFYLIMIIGAIILAFFGVGRSKGKMAALLQELAEKKTVL